MTARVLVMAWDGADRHVVQDLLDEGRLPALAELCDGGRLETVDEQPGLSDDAAWCSFSTGIGPGVHGRFHHRQIVPGTYHYGAPRRADVSQEPFWGALALDGHRVAVIDVPKSPLVGGIDGVEVADWMPHGEDGPAPVIASGGAEIARRFEAVDDFDCHRRLETAAEAAEHAAAIRRRGERRAHTTTELLASDRWDLFLTVAAETHCAGHHFWHLHDPRHPSHDPRLLERIGDPVADSCIAADRSLGELVAAAGPDASVLVFSPTGMGPDHWEDGLADEVLRRFEAQRGVPPPRRRRFRRRRAVGVPPNPADRLAWPVAFDAVSSPIRLNLIGREPAGRVTPGRDADRLGDEIAAAFIELCDTATGRPVVRDVVRVGEIHPGPAERRFADLLVVWNGELPLTRVASPRFGPIEVTTEPHRTGNHRGSGWSTATIAGQAAGIIELGEQISAAVRGGSG